MLNKLIIAIGSAMTIALISFGVYLARELVARTPIAYWHLETAHNAFDYADTYIILLVGVGIGVCYTSGRVGIPPRGVVSITIAQWVSLQPTSNLVIH